MCRECESTVRYSSSVLYLVRFGQDECTQLEKGKACGKKIKSSVIALSAFFFSMSIPDCNRGTKKQSRKMLFNPHLSVHVEKIKSSILYILGDY